jgi:hypothetical protein
MSRGEHCSVFSTSYALERKIDGIVDIYIGRTEALAWWCVFSGGITYFVTWPRKLQLFLASRSHPYSSATMDITYRSESSRGLAIIIYLLSQLLRVRCTGGCANDGCNIHYVAGDLFQHKLCIKLKPGTAFFFFLSHIFSSKSVQYVANFVFKSRTHPVP